MKDNYIKNSDTKRWPKKDNQVKNSDTKRWPAKDNQVKIMTLKDGLSK